MKVFISWSGDASRPLAEALGDWLPRVLQYVQPFVSSSDTEKGVRWATVVSKELAETQIGIICLTPDNLKSEWILFEAGALSKEVERGKVCPLLFFGIEASDVTGPLALFQCATFSKGEMARVVRTINADAGGHQLPDTVLADTFEMWWPKLEAAISSARTARPPAKPAHKRESREIP